MHLTRQLLSIATLQELDTTNTNTVLGQGWDGMTMTRMNSICENLNEANEPLNKAKKQKVGKNRPISAAPNLRKKPLLQNLNNEKTFHEKHRSFVKPMYEKTLSTAAGT